MDELDAIFPDLAGLVTQDWTPTGGNNLVADPEHGGVTAESLDAYLTDTFARGQRIIPPVQTSGGGVTNSDAPPDPAPSASPTPPPAEEDDDEDDGLDDEPVPPAGVPAEAPPADTSPIPPAVPAPDVLDIGGRQFTREQLIGFAQFSEQLQSDPALQQLLVQHYLGQQAPPIAPLPAAFVPPVPTQGPATPSLDFSDIDDPRLTQLAQIIEQQQAQLTQLANAQSITRQTQLQQSAQDALTLINRAAHSFQEEHSLTDEQMRRIRSTAEQTGILDRLMMSPIDPVTQIPRRPDLLRETSRALELTMYSDPEVRQQIVNDAIAEQRKTNRKRQKLAGIGGSGGSVSRSAPAVVPGTPEARSAMLDEVAQMQAGTWQPR